MSAENLLFLQCSNVFHSTTYLPSEHLNVSLAELILNSDVVKLNSKIK
jgi:hypothetical protein